MCVPSILRETREGVFVRFSNIVFCRLLNMSQQKSRDSSDDVKERIYLKLFFKSLEQIFDRLYLRFNKVNERIDRVEANTQRGQPPRTPNVQQRERNPPRPDYDDEYGDNLDDDERASNANLGQFGCWNGARGVHFGDRVDNNFGSIKLKIPSFQGKNDPKAYSEWEKMMELVFDCHNYSDLKKLKLATIEFTDYVIVWWYQLTLNKRRNGERAIETWEEMKAIMRSQFIPSHYHRDLFQKLQSLTQGSKSVEDYYKEMEIAMIRANVKEDREL